MYSLNFNTQQYNNYNTVKAVSTTKVEKNEHVKENKTSFTSNPIMTQIPYNPALTASRLRTELISKDEKNKYNHLVSISDKETKKNLNMLLKTGILLNSDSNDNSTTLDNLYKIATTQRAQGLSGDVILKNTIDTLANPHMITQQFGNIPSKYRAQVEAVEKNKNDNVKRIIDYRLPKLDAYALECLKAKAKENNKSIKESLEDIKDILLNNRMLMNKEQGYPVFTIANEPNFQYNHLKIELSKIKEIYIYSDGITQAFDELKIYSSCEDLFSHEVNITELIRQIVNVANSDPELNRYPRFKKNDDISIIKITF